MSMRFVIDRLGLSTVAGALTLAVSVLVLSVGAVPAGAACPNEQLRAEQPYGLELPDCRAYEMVSPLEKNDNNVTEGQARASVSGDAVTYISKGSFAEPQSAMFSDRYLSRRGPDGWSTKNITPPYHAFVGNLSNPFKELLFTPDLSKGLLFSELTPLTSGSPDGYNNIYVADTRSGSYEAVTGPPPGLAPYRALAGGSAEEEGEPKAGGTSSDLRRVVFQERAFAESRLPGLSPEHTHIYEWAAGRLIPIDVSPVGKSFEAEDEIGAPGHPGGPESGDVWHAVSADGSRVFFTAGSFTEEESREAGHDRAAVGQIYVREVDNAKTIEVSASQRAIPDPNDRETARYWDASADGSRVFFSSKAELTDNANTGTADNAPNLYEYDLETGVLTDLTVDTNPADENGASLLGLVTASDDGAYVYFVAKGVLAAGAVSGQPNLYVYHSGKLSLISTLAPSVRRDETGLESGGDSKDWKGAEPGRKQASSGSFGPGSHTVRVTRGGTQLAFESESSLTGYDNQPLEPSRCENDRCREVYVYDVLSGGLRCVSCERDGTRPTGPAELGGSGESEGGAEAVGGIDFYYEPRNFSGDGSRLFFQSPDPLVRHDSNGRQDVYEYEGGQVYPISDVAGTFDSSFLDASASGNDVFIAADDQLLPSDTDFRVDVYDVKTGGGLPVSVTPPACENGDSCKAPASAQPGVFGAPASATFSGAGNVSQAGASVSKAKVRAKVIGCKKGMVKRGGRCVKKAHGPVGHSKKGRK